MTKKFFYKLCAQNLAVTRKYIYKVSRTTTRGILIHRKDYHTVPSNWALIGEQYLYTDDCNTWITLHDSPNGDYSLCYGAEDLEEYLR